MFGFKSKKQKIRDQEELRLQEEVQKELKDLKEKQKTLVDQLNEDDPKIIEFVKRANRVWRYSYEKSDLKRKNNKNKKSSIMGLVLLAIYFIVPFFFITKPYGWILPVFSVVVCACQGILQIFKMKPREYELKYNDIPSFWRYAEFDDNDIVCATKDKWWVILLRVCVLLIPIAISVEIIITKIVNTIIIPLFSFQNFFILTPFFL